MAPSSTKPNSAVCDFSTCGTMARPAGVPGMYGAPVGFSTFPFGTTMPKGGTLEKHALQTHSPYPDHSVKGWQAPGREANIKPTATMTGAGVVSGGSIDNTYLPKPLQNAWGKKRERMKNEVFKPPHKQCSDLIIVSKGAPAGVIIVDGREEKIGFSAPKQTIEDIAAVRPTYSRTIPVYHPLDPVRIESGFIRPPNLIPGAKPAPGPPAVEEQPGLGATHHTQKLAYDQTMNGIGGGRQGRIPVSRVVKANEQMKPQGAYPLPIFVTKPAGLPGGLSLIDNS